jgi:hypothetical protein
MIQTPHSFALNFVLLFLLYLTAAAKRYHQSSFFFFECLKTVSSWGFAPDPTRKAHNAHQAA